MKWLARIRAPYALATKNRLKDQYSWHQALWKSFPGCDRGSRDFLSRVEKTERGYTVYLLSSNEPVCPPWCPPEYWEITRIKDPFLDHQYYRFDLLANPTRKLMKIDGNGIPTKNGRRQAYLRPQEQMEWLKRKGDLGGFRILDVPPLELEKAQRLTFTRNHKMGSHFAVKFRGVLKVSDRLRFRKVFRQGIGSAKGFGFGMLMLEPIAL